jgi:hypothetical protein
MRQTLHFLGLSPDGQDAMAKRPISSDGESIAGYFRKIFEENPKLLKTRSNQELLNRWLMDHPGHRTIPSKVKGALANVKSILRKKRRERARRQEAEPPVLGAAGALKKPIRGLDLLEEQIDDCLTAAKTMDREGLAEVISLLRRARNAVVWLMGQ